MQPTQSSAFLVFSGFYVDRIEVVVVILVFIQQNGVIEFDRLIVRILVA